MAIQGKVRKIVAEDIDFGTSTVSIQKADGTIVTANQVNASQLPTSDDRNVENIIKGVGYSIDEFTDLVDAIAKIGSQDATLVIGKEVVLNQDLTVPENICLKFLKGGKITINTGYTLTIDGAIEAGLWQIFDGDGTITGNPKIEVVYPEWFGAKGDGVNDDTIAIQKTIDSFAKVNVFFSNKEYVVSKSITISNGFRIYEFNKTTITPVDGNYNEMYEYGSDTPLGVYVVLDLQTNKCYFHGTLTSNNKNAIPNMCFIGASTLGKSYKHIFDCYLLVYDYEYAIYGQGTTVSVAGSFTGSIFKMIDIYNCNISFSNNQDDIKIETLRFHDGIFVPNDCVIDEFYLYQGKISLPGYKTLKINRLFVEGNFIEYPIVINGNNACLIVDNLSVSPNFSSSTGEVIFTGVDKCTILIKVQGDEYQGGHSGILRRYSSTTGQMYYKIIYPYGYTKPPIIYTDTTATGKDLIEVISGNKRLLGNQVGTSVIYIEFNSNGTSLYITDQTTNEKFIIPKSSVYEYTDLINGGRYSIHNHGSLIKFNASSDISIYTYGSIIPGQIVTLVASGLGNVTLISDTTGPIKFASGVSSFTLLANMQNSLTLLYDGSQWIEISSASY